jgi:hypothetical protein
MPGRMRRVGWPVIGGACVLALILSFVVARAGEEPRPDARLVPAIPANEPAASTPTSALGRAQELPALAPEPPKPKPSPAKAPDPPAPAPTPKPAPPLAAPPPAEPAYTPPPVPVPPAQPAPAPAPAPAPQPAPPPQPEPSPPVSFDDSG